MLSSRKEDLKKINVTYLTTPSLTKAIVHLVNQSSIVFTVLTKESNFLSQYHFSQFSTNKSKVNAKRADTFIILFVFTEI